MFSEDKKKHMSFTIKNYDFKEGVSYRPYD